MNEEENVIIAIHSAREHASRDEDWALQFSMYAAIANALADG